MFKSIFFYLLVSEANKKNPVKIIINANNFLSVSFSFKNITPVINTVKILNPKTKEGPTLISSFFAIE